MDKNKLVKFSLVENALDSIELGLEYFYEAKKEFTPRKYKQCLINMFHGSELRKVRISRSFLPKLTR